MGGEVKQDQLQLVSDCAIRRGLGNTPGRAGAGVGQGTAPKEG